MEEPRPLIALAPNGSRIIGTQDTIPAVAHCTFYENPDDPANPERDYDGETKVDWDGQTTDNSPEGEDLYADEQGGVWPRSRLRFILDFKAAPIVTLDEARRLLAYQVYESDDNRRPAIPGLFVLSPYGRSDEAHDIRLWPGYQKGKSLSKKTSNSPTPSEPSRQGEKKSRSPGSETMPDAVGAIIHDQQFLIRAERQAEALSAVLAWETLTGAKPIFGRDGAPETLEELFRDYGFDPQTDRRGNIGYLNFWEDGGERADLGPAGLLGQIAPWVEEGSYLVFIDEGLQAWRLRYEGGRAVEETGRIVCLFD